MDKIIFLPENEHISTIIFLHGTDLAKTKEEIVFNEKTRKEFFKLSLFSRNHLPLTAELTFPQALGGVICLSGILPLYQSACQLAENKKPKTSVLICHGEKDKLVPLWISQTSIEILMDNDYLGIHDLREYLREKLYQYDSIKNEVVLQNKINLKAN
ncbi:15165_t:CDS:2, partial [Racocetra fulgida]